MSSFSTSQLEKKLKVMTMSQQSIQTLSLWCIHHRKHARTVVQTWLKDILRGNQHLFGILLWYDCLFLEISKYF